MFIHGRRDVADVFMKNLEMGPGRPSVIPRIRGGKQDNELGGGNVTTEAEVREERRDPA